MFVGETKEAGGTPHGHEMLGESLRRSRKTRVVGSGFRVQVEAAVLGGVDRGAMHSRNRRSAGALSFRERRLARWQNADSTNERLSIGSIRLCEEVEMQKARDVGIVEGGQTKSQRAPVDG